MPKDPQLSLWPSKEDLAALPYRPSRSLLTHPSSPRILKMLSYVLRFFPELRDETIVVGVTKGADGRAVVGAPRIWLNPRLLCYHTIAHELVHVLQGRFGIPSGERSCDLYALARDATLVDMKPAYLKVSEHAFDPDGKPLSGVAQVITMTAREALEKRSSGYRRYISWFEKTIPGRLDGGRFELPAAAEERPRQMRAFGYTRWLDKD